MSTAMCYHGLSGKGVGFSSSGLFSLDINPQALDGVINPSCLLPDGVYKHITISRASFEQKRGNSV